MDCPPGSMTRPRAQAQLPLRRRSTAANIVIPLLAAIIIAAPFAGAASDALGTSSTILEHCFRCSTDDLTVEQRGAFDLVRLRGCDLIGEPGAPSLPSLTLRFAIPSGWTATAVEVVSVETIELPGTYRSLPAPAPQPIDGLASVRQAESLDLGPDPAIYTSQRPFPGQTVEFLGQSDLTGQAMAFVRVHPLQYIPAEGRLHLATAITFRVIGAPGYVCRDYLPANASPAARAAYERALRAMVINPQDVQPAAAAPGTGGAPQPARLEPGSFDYVIITRADWVDDFQPLADWRTREGLPATIVTTEWIFNESGYGGSNLENMRAFFADAHATWGASYFLLGADVPTLPFHLRTITVPGYQTDVISNYTYFADYDDDWVCEVHLGNASVQSAQQISDFIGKVFAYEKTPPLGGYTETAAFLGFDISICGDGHGESFKEGYIRADWLPADWALVTEYDSEPGLHKADVISYLRQGHHLVNHHDHCHNTLMGTGWICHGELLEIPDVYTLNNGERTSIVFAIGCHPAEFAIGSCIGEVFLRLTGGGAIAFIGNTCIGWGGSVEDPIHYTMRQDYYLYRNLFDLDILRLGENFTLLKNDEYDPYDPYNLHQYCFTQLHLLGDPGLRVWSAEPQPLTVSHEHTLAGGQPCNFAVDVSGPAGPLDGAVVCLWKGDEVYEVAQTAGGTAFFALPAMHDGVLLVTVTNRNHLPYEGQAQVETDPMPVAPAGPAASSRLALLGVSPNPSAGMTWIRFTAPGGAASGVVDLGVYNCQGRRVRGLVHEPLAAGSHLCAWDGCDDQGRAVPSGIYFAELREVLNRGEAAAARQRVILLR